MTINLKRLDMPIKVLNQKPLGFRTSDIPIKLCLLKKRVILLCPVNKLNKVPKGLAVEVQGDFCMEDNFENKDGLLTDRGIIYLWPTAIHQL